MLSLEIDYFLSFHSQIFYSKINKGRSMEDSIIQNIIGWELSSERELFAVKF